MHSMIRGPKSLPAFALLAVSALAPVRTAWAVCKEPLPAVDLHALDALAIADPVTADRQASAALLTVREPARRAQLHAIRADAHNTTGEDDASLQDIREGRAELAAAGPFSGADKVGLRLALVEADAAHTREEMLAAVSGLDRWRAAAQSQPIGRACLLLVRSRVLSRLLMHEQSARDGLEAHAIAMQSGSEDALSETHFQLANAFRRAGLFDQALAHVDATIALGRARGQAAVLAGAAYLKGQVLGDAGRISEAHESMRESRRISRETGDAVSAGFADMNLCDFEMRLGRAVAARQRCRDAREALGKAGREDMVSLTEDLEARIDIAEGKPAVALRRLNAILRDGGKALPPYGLAAAYRDIAEAHTRLGQPAQAAAALRQFLEADEIAHQRQRSLAAALALAQSDRQAQERREADLSREVLQRGEQASAAAASRQKAWALLAASLAIIGLLLALLSAARRNARVLRSQEALFRAVSDHSPDAIALLAADGRIRFANRDLFWQDAPPAQNKPLLEAVPASLKDSMREVLATLLGEGVAVERDLRVQSRDGADQWRDVELRAFPIFQSGQLLGATVRTADVTARRSVERAAHEWLERQRERAGDDLHEGLAQALTGVSMRLGAMARAQRSGKAVAADTIEASIAQLSGAIAATLDLASDLSPLVAGRGSLQDALARLAADPERRFGAPVRFTGTWHPLPELGRAGELLFRIAELALLACSKEASSAVTTLRVEPEPDGIELVVEAGSGFQTLDQQALQLIRYLATLLGASTHMEPLGQAGWRLRVAVPRSGFTR